MTVKILLKMKELKINTTFAIDIFIQIEATVFRNYLFLQFSHEKVDCRLCSKAFQCSNSKLN